MLELARADRLAAELRRRLRLGGRRPRTLVTGSVRRRAPRVADLDLLVVLPALPAGPAPLAGLALAPGGRAELLAVRPGARYTRLRVRPAPGAPSVQVDLFATTPAALPFAQFHYTGSRQYNIRVRAAAKRRGWRLNQYGLWRRDSGRAAVPPGRVRSERDLADVLGVTYRAPPDRSA